MDGTFSWGSPPPKLTAHDPKAGEKKKKGPSCVIGAPAANANGEVKPVLHGVDLEVQRGELLIVVGEVGSGKSSLLAAMLGKPRDRQEGMHGVGGIGSRSAKGEPVDAGMWLVSEA